MTGVLPKSIAYKELLTSLTSDIYSTTQILNPENKF